MTSLYDLLGAREDDDADALKKAFRQAVKAHHPDLHPGDPDAPERFRQLIAANALLRDAKQRASYDRVLQLERQQFQLRLECHQLRSKLDRQQVRLKRMRATAAIAAVGALVGGYGLFSPISTTAIVAINKDEHAAAAVAAVKKGRQTAAVIAAAQMNEDTPTAAPKADAVKGDLDNSGKPVETTGAQLMDTTNPPDRGEPRDKHDDAEVPSGASKPNVDASPTDSTDAPVIAGRELAAGPPTNDANFYRERGIAAYRSGDFQGAIGNFNEAIRLNRNDAQSHNIRGNVWDELGVSERALADYDEAIRIDPNNPAVFRDRAILWHRKGALDEALLDLDRAIRFSFSDVNMYCDRGLVWYQKSQHNRAIADFNQAIKLDPDSAAACIKRGLIVHRDSEFKLALATVNKAIRVDPSIFDALRPANSPP